MGAYVQSPFECRRGALTIRGTEYRPAGKDLPVAIVSHPFMANQKAVEHYAQALAEMGYAAYTFDFCGGCVRGTSDGATTEMSVLTEAADLEAVMEFTRSLPYTGAGLVLMGCSQGGFVSGLTAAKHPDLVEKLVMFYPALSIPDDARAGKMVFARFDPQNIPERIPCGRMMLGRCYPVAVMEMDPISTLTTYGGPVLIVHGTADPLVDPGYSRRAAAGYANAQLFLMENAGHGFQGEQDGEAIAHLRAFLSR